MIKAGFSFSSRQSSDTVHIAKTVGDVLFNGYDDPLIEMGKMIPSAWGLNMPPFDKFGWFYTVILLSNHKSITYLDFPNF